MERLYAFNAGNLVLQDTTERLFVQNIYADIERGLFLVRGENVLLLGEIVRFSVWIVCCKAVLMVHYRISTKTNTYQNPTKSLQWRRSSP